MFGHVLSQNRRSPAMDKRLVQEVYTILETPTCMVSVADPDSRYLWMPLLYPEKAV
jgi:hypothetical protein